MKTRIIKTCLWSDEKIEKLSYTSRYLFVYLISNPQIGLTGAYQITSKRIKFETGLNTAQVGKGFKELASMGMVTLADGNWVIITNALKHNNYSRGPTTGEAYEKELEILPDHVKDKLPEV